VGLMVILERFDTVVVACASRSFGKSNLNLILLESTLGAESLQESILRRVERKFT
jgi:hypothetical protein